MCQILLALQRAWQSSVSQQKVAQLLLIAIHAFAQTSAARCSSKAARYVAGVSSSSMFSENQLLANDSAADADARVLGADDDDEPRSREARDLAPQQPAVTTCSSHVHAHSVSDPATASASSSNCNSSCVAHSVSASYEYPYEGIESVCSELALLLVPSDAPGASDFDALSATDIADQMTRLDHAIFCAIQHEYANDFFNLFSSLSLHSTVCSVVLCSVHPLVQSISKSSPHFCLFSHSHSRTCTCSCTCIRI